MAQCPTPGEVSCGTACRPASRCCVPSAGWICGNTQHICSIVTGTVNCVDRSSRALTSALTCNNYGTSCTDNDCFICTDKLLPLCYPLVYTSGTVVLRKTSCAITSDVVTIIGDKGVAESSATTTTDSIVPSVTAPRPAPETSPPAPQQTSPPAAASGMSTGEIVGIVIGLCAFFVLAAILVVVLRRRKVAVSASQEYEAEVLGAYVPELAEPAMGTVSKAPARAELM